MLLLPLTILKLLVVIDFGRTIISCHAVGSSNIIGSTANTLVNLMEYVIFAVSGMNFPPWLIAYSNKLYTTGLLTTAYFICDIFKSGICNGWMNCICYNWRFIPFLFQAIYWNNGQYLLFKSNPKPYGWIGIWWREVPPALLIGIDSPLVISTT